MCSTIIFTLCSLNYLGQAKTLGDSICETNPSVRFIIGLVDKIPTNLPANLLGKHEILLVENIGLEPLEDMAARYSIVEFLTSVKPYYFDYLFRSNPSCKSVIYMDPDIMVFSPLDELINNLSNYEIILTPQISAPMPDNLLPTEKHVFDTGLYNLGFLGLSRGTNMYRMLDWWKHKLRYECIVDLSRGYFVDQLWMNLVPIYYEGVLIEKDPGYNMAHWNLHERLLAETDGRYYVNDRPLIFFHFSHYKPSKPQNIAAYHNRYNFEARPDLKRLFSVYNQNLITNEFNKLINYKCFYINDEKSKELKKSITAFLRRNVPQKVKIAFSNFRKKNN